MKKSKLNRNKLFIRPEEIQHLHFFSKVDGKMVTLELICGDAARKHTKKPNSEKDESN